MPIVELPREYNRPLIENTDPLTMGHMPPTQRVFSVEYNMSPLVSGDISACVCFNLLIM